MVKALLILVVLTGSAAAQLTPAMVAQKAAEANTWEQRAALSRQRYYLYYRDTLGPGARADAVAKLATATDAKTRANWQKRLDLGDAARATGDAELPAGDALVVAGQTAEVDGAAFLAAGDIYKAYMSYGRAGNRFGTAQRQYQKAAASHLGALQWWKF